MNNNLSLASIFVTLAILCGCHGEKSGRSNSHAERSLASYTQSDLEKMIVPGMSITEVTNKLGSPGSAIPVSSNTLMLIYSLPIEETQSEVHFAGLNIYIKDGKVDRWHPITSESRKTPDPSGRSQRPPAEKTFEVFLVTEPLTNLFKAFQAEGSASTAGLQSAPDLRFKAKVLDGGATAPGSDERFMTLVVNDADAVKVRALTEANFGKRILVAWRNRVIAAPVIREPITSNQFRIRTRDPLRDLLP
jgi:hypothetical protein